MATAWVNLERVMLNKNKPVTEGQREAEVTVVGAGGWGQREWKMLFSGCRVPLVPGEQVLEIREHAACSQQHSPVHLQVKRADLWVHPRNQPNQPRKKGYRETLGDAGMCMT